MTRTLIFASLSLVATLACAAEKTPPQAPPPSPKDLQVAPPPDMNDPGVKSAVDAEVAAAKADAAKNTNGSPRPPKDSTVTVRQEGDDTIEEYRTGGKVSMIRVTRKGGVPHEYIDTDGDGKLEGNPKDGPVAPVYYRLYEWN